MFFLGSCEASSRGKVFESVLPEVTDVGAVEWDSYEMYESWMEDEEAETEEEVVTMGLCGRPIVTDIKGV